MKSNHCFILSLLLASLWLGFMVDHLHAAPSGQVIVEGFISDRDGKPIAGVTVRAESKGKPVAAPVQSDANGRYTLAVDSGQPFDLVYDHSSFHPSTLSGLSGARNQTINKVLYVPGEEYKFEPAIALNIMESYESLYVLHAANSESKYAKELFGSRLNRFVKLPVDFATRSPVEQKKVTNLLNYRLQSVRRLYELDSLPKK